MNIVFPFDFSFLSHSKGHLDRKHSNVPADVLNSALNLAQSAHDLPPAIASPMLNYGQLSTVNFQNETYNMIHITDRLLNKLIQTGLVRFSNGRIFLKDFLEQE